VNDPLLPLNPAEFHKMAHRDIPGLVALAEDYFRETRRLIPQWRDLVASGEFDRLRDELHRCKGGASLFGLERMVALLGKCESASYLETHGFDMAVLEVELTDAEKAVAALVAGVHKAP
jgi:HPt (histidine-containing phosphotransfer) domain-containing protein